MADSGGNTRVTVGAGREPAALATSVTTALAALQAQITALSAAVAVIAKLPGPITPDGTAAAAAQVGTVAANTGIVTSNIATAISQKLFSD